jgi:Domain of unknown function (DUF4399)/Family of unknown function (DUF6130)
MNFYKISTHISILSLLVFSLSFAACMNCCRPKKRVFFENLKDNQFLPENFQIRFGFENLQVKPAGVDIENKSAGHFHILIDNHIHYGKGQTEAVLTLSPGKHTLTLQFADGAHRSYGKVLSSTITVNVKAKANSL